MSSALVDVPAPAAERLARRVRSGGRTVKVVAPLTGDVLTRLPVSGPADVAAAYDRARAARAAWEELSPKRRAEPFVALHDAILDRREEILDIVQAETGKARRHAFEEVLDVAGCAL